MDISIVRFWRSTWIWDVLGVWRAHDGFLLRPDADRPAVPFLVGLLGAIDLLEYRVKVIRNFKLMRQ